VIALDTNVLLRYLVQDDLAQSATATRILEHVLTPDDPGFVPIVAVLEIDWVLRVQYEFSPVIVAATLRKLMASPNLVFEQAVAVEQALEFEFGDLADNILHETAQANGCRKTLTFDRKFARLPGVELLQ
jgi:predicted nucleic-acid-binding protein